MVLDRSTGLRFGDDEGGILSSRRSPFSASRSLPSRGEISTFTENVGVPPLLDHLPVGVVAIIVITIRPPPLAIFASKL